MRSSLAAFTTTLLLLVIGSPAWPLDLQAHRGGRGLMPENTLAAFEHALELGVATLEMDVAITADGVAAVSHVRSRDRNNAADPAWTAGRLARDYPSVAHMIRAAGGAIRAPNFDSIDEPAVRNAQALGLQVMPWTVNEPADMQRLLDWKVDGIITDHPDHLRTVMRERGLPLPAGVKR
jgi:glycerophosphoryl diester phosphodiesterase